jgi:predicted phage baseplate assembly protein
MPIRPPALDDRRYQDLVDEVLARIPAHTPEWTHPRAGDPGRTLIELFAWLTDTLLYRANLIPERQRLAFLRLLGVSMRAALPAQGLVSVQIDDDTVTQAIVIQPRAAIDKPVSFETKTELTVLPVTAEAYYKRLLTDEEQHEMAGVVPGLQSVYRLSVLPTPYVTTPIFVDGKPELEGFDLMTQTVDRSLWLAILAPKASTAEQQPVVVEQIRATLGRSASGGQQLLSIGVVPSIEVPALFEEIGPRARIPHVWELGTVDERGEPDYLTLDAVADSTLGLTRRGIVRLALPSASRIRVPSNDVRTNLKAGVGDAPPRLDQPDKAVRLVAWIRLRPTVTSLQRLSVSWVGVNAVELDQRKTLTHRIVGQSSGAADQEVQLPGQSIEAESLVIEVEESGRGFQPWQRIEDLALAGRDATVYQLDREAGTIRFGDGLRGRIPEAGRRIQVALLRAGGGLAGNLPPGSLTKITARDLRGVLVTTKLKLRQPLPTEGGEDAETLAEAERRIPALFRHRDRAVTESDYQELAARTPGVRMGRVEVLPRFKPQQRRSDVPGVVSVMVVPFKDGWSLPNPRPDRPFLEAVHGMLDPRRPLSTELYVIGCEYVSLGVSVAITVKDGFGAGTSESDSAGSAGFSREGVVAAVREALRRYLWPLPPGGTDSTGWPLGRPVRDRELEVVVARVPGVNGVAPINLFQREGNEWRKVPRASVEGAVQVPLQAWQLPELLSVVVIVGDEAPDDLRGVPNPFADQAGIAVPVVPDVC